MGTIKKVKRTEDLTPEETQRIRRSLTKNAKTVKANPDNYLQGKEARKHKNRGKVINGEFNWRFKKNDPLIVR